MGEGGNIVISFTDIQRAIEDNAEGTTATGLTISGGDGEIVVGIEGTGESITYNFIPSVTEDGRFSVASRDEVVGDNETQRAARIIKFLISPEMVGNAFENGVNSYLSGNDLRLVGVQVETDRIILQVAPQ